MDDDHFENYTLKKKRNINFTIEDDDCCLKSGKAASKSLVTKAKDDVNVVKLSKHNTCTVLPPEEAQEIIRKRIEILLADKIL